MAPTGSPATFCELAARITVFEKTRLSALNQRFLSGRSISQKKIPRRVRGVFGVMNIGFIEHHRLTVTPEI
ncbi:MAG: hypothetical protein RR758_05590 [Burkholderiaceae bacterium]